MNKDLVARVRGLGNRVFYLGGYRSGGDEKGLDSLCNHMNIDLNFVLPETPYCAEIDIEKLLDVDETKLIEWEKRIESITKEVQSSTVYQKALQAYKYNNQEEIGKVMTSIFYNKQLKRARTLYHGVMPRKITQGDLFTDFDEEKPPVCEYVSPDKYVDLILRIQEEGLLPSIGGHHSLDENLRPIFTVPDYENTYGLLFFEMNPIKYGYSVFEVAGGEEYLIYTPRLIIPMQLCLKSADFMDYERIKSTVDVDNIPQLIAYRDDLEKTLQERGVNFKLVDPHYVENLKSF